MSMSNVKVLDAIHYQSMEERLVCKEASERAKERLIPNSLCTFLALSRNLEGDDENPLERTAQ